MMDVDDSYEVKLMIELCRHHLKQVTTLQQPVLEVLLEREEQLPMDFAELLEEAANIYLSVSKRIRPRTH